MTHRGIALLGLVLVVAITGCGEDVPHSGEPSNSEAVANFAAEGEAPAAPEDACLDCARARASHAVCRECGTPYLCGIDVRSTDLHDLVDAPGHRYDPASLRCAACRDAVTYDGWCAKDGVGFRRNVVHASRLGHTMSFGASAPDARYAECGTCASSRTDPQWCIRCGHGRVGNLAFVNRERFTLATAEFGRLRRAADYADECELCVLAHFSGMTCPTCKTVHPKVGTPSEGR
ncbi:MAG: hypothetical protein AAF488_17195 [Planctomycetota bacterium]